jgi:pimeloyl-ACP methyl ester carboxylesterase
MTYIEIAGRRVWHEVSGEGDPVVLLHGAFAGASSWGAQVPALVAAGFQVYAPERRGHVHTRDVPGPITYSLMADDTIGYLDVIFGDTGLGQRSHRAHLVGWSDGAVVGLLVALRRPDLVDRLVLIGQYYNSAGKVAHGLADEGLEVDSETIAFLRAEYDQASPDGPDHFTEVYAKIMHMIATEPEIRLATLAAVEASTLVLQGDRDEVTVAHSALVAAAIPNARLAVVPGSHGLPIESPEVVNPMLLWWLRGGPPEPLF